jgi:hypothetical protein
MATSVREDNMDLPSRRAAPGVAAALCLVVSSAFMTFAAESPSRAPSPDPRNIEGIWIRGSNTPRVGDTPLTDYSGNLPYTAAGLAAYNYRRDMSAAGTPLQDMTAQCMPEGLPRAITAHYPFQVIQTPAKTVIVQEMMRESRIVYMNENHTKPPQLRPSFMGHSIGHWEGDTLVIDTIGLLQERTQWDFAPISDKVHVTERIRKIDGGRKLENVVTIDDPTLYKQPWSARMVFNWAPDDHLAEFVCEESPERPSNQPEAKDP